MWLYGWSSLNQTIGGLFITTNFEMFWKPKYIRVHFIVILESVFSLKTVFKHKKIGVWQILENTSKNLKNHL